MDKNSFKNVLHHYSECSVEEAQEILSLLQRYPYSQVLHALAARVCKDHGFSNQQEVLQLAAVYASDRSVLKDVLSKDDVLAEHKIIKTPETLPVNAEPVVTEKDPSPGPSVDFADEVVQDLKRLSQSRKNFENMFTKISGEQVFNEAEPDEATEENPETERVGVEESKIKAKKARIVELAKALLESNSIVIPPFTRKKKENAGDGLINEIANTKTEINPETEKQKNQIEVIDQFIKAQPSLVNTKEKVIAAPVGDLSTIKTGEFGDHIVSETLVDILLKQGKKDKAIEVLKKLIWKFPQKKAYFAAQIEELKK